MFPRTPEFRLPSSSKTCSSSPGDSRRGVRHQAHGGHRAAGGDTAQLKRQYEKALSLIQSSLTQGNSQAAFLHGSFGSGKSHFMAVLNLPLQGTAKAWSHAELGTVTVHYAGLRDKRLLLLAFHMIGARSMESAVFGGYAKHVQQLHPEAPITPLFRGEGLFADARKLMETMGEEAYFGKLWAQPCCRTGCRAAMP